MILVFGRNRILKHVFIRPEGELPFNDHEQLFACAKANLAAVYGEPSMVSASSMAKDMQTLQFRKGDVEVVIQYMPFISSINIIYEAPSEKGL